MFERRNKWEILEDAWRKAATSNEYIIEFPSFQDAMNMRARLYACIRRARKPKTFNQELLLISNAYSITVEGGKLAIYRQTVSPQLRHLEEVLVKQDISESEGLLNEILAKQGLQVEEKSKLTPSTNPYYTR